MIKLENVNKYFNKHKKNEIHVINNLTLEIKDKGLVSLLGESGCGKTTLLNAISGLDKVNSGNIYIDGKRITKRSSYYIDKIRNLNIGYIFQDYNLINNLTVYENVALVLKIIGIKDEKEISKRVNYTLEKVGLYRYRNRYVTMLSGGQKQRVGIARAIVKNPNIIIADEPTGNLDSKNTIEVMNIIKSISKNKLVILVTHEKQIAEFYSDRILDIEDGKIINDRINKHDRTLDYRFDNKIYLKDLKYNTKLEKDNLTINYYADTNNIENIDIVCKNGNIYIKTNKNVEIVNKDSNISLVNDNYKEITKKDYEEYDFDYSKIDNSNIELKYSKVYNTFKIIKNGFKKIKTYPLMKKILLVGFFVSGMFITNAISNAYGVTRINDNDFVTINKNYITIDNKKISIDTYEKYSNNELINYVIPTDSIVGFNIKYNDYYQTSDTVGTITGSLSSKDMINNNDIIYGRNIENDYEVILDIKTFKNYIENSAAKQAGILSYKDLLNKEIYINNMKPFKVVGFTDTSSPSIYIDNKYFINVLYNTNKDYSYTYGINDEQKYIDYNLVKDNISIKKGRYPENDYEVIVSYLYENEYKLNKEIDNKINDKKLKVVGYYEGNKTDMLVNENMIKYDLINNSEKMSVYAKDNDKVIKDLRDNGLNASLSYDKSKADYQKQIKDSVNTSLIICLITGLISMIEIYLMIRSSFLSRIKEVGIYRAVGMKKSDIRRMFSGEIIAITTLGSLTGVIFMSFIIKQLSTVSYFSHSYLMTPKIFILSILFIYIFNLLVGLLPVNLVLRLTPARILSRTDID